MENFLEVKNLSLGFNIDDIFYPAIKNVSFKLNKGEMLAIIGESGSGKTMSVMSIINLLPKNAKITSGEIIYNGINLLKLKEKELNKIRGAKIALIPQDPMTSLNPLYTAESQMIEAIMAHKNCKKKEAKEIALSKLEASGVKEPDKKLKSYPYELSGGIKQRVIIATALSLDPDIIIADEPTTALDVTVQAQILELLDKIKNLGKGIILISHDLGVVNQYADTVSIMYSGRIIETAGKKTLFKSPKHPYTNALMQALPYSKEKRLKNIEGLPSPVTEHISGCEFHTRCDFCKDICINKIFPLKLQKDGSYIACRLFE